MENVSLAAHIDAWTREALALWGADWPRVSEHIERQMARLDDDERRRLQFEARLTLTEPPAAACN